MLTSAFAIIRTPRKRTPAASASSCAVFAPLSRLSKMPCCTAAAMIMGGAYPQASCISLWGVTCGCADVDIHLFYSANDAERRDGRRGLVVWPIDSCPTCPTTLLVCATL